MGRDPTYKARFTGEEISIHAPVWGATNLLKLKERI